MLYSNQFAKGFGTKETAQSRPIPGREKDMNSNNAGGYTYVTSDEQHIRRFLILGTESPTYYQSSSELTLDAAKGVLEYARANAGRLAYIIDNVNSLSFDEGGNTIPAAVARKSPSIFALAIAKVFASTDTDRAMIHDVIRKRNVISTFAQMMEFLANIYIVNEGTIPHGNGFKRALADWAVGEGRDERWLAMQFAKYRNRRFRVGSGSNSYVMNARNFLRMSHIKPRSPVQQQLLAWAVNMGRDGNDVKKVSSVDMSQTLRVKASEMDSDVLDYAGAFEELQLVTDGQAAVRLIKDYGLTWEMVPSELYGKNAAASDRRAIWRALLGLDGASRQMPYNAMLRNIPRMTVYGILDDQDARSFIMNALANEEAIVRSRLHPISLLSNYRVYMRGFTWGNTRYYREKSLEWVPDNGIASTIEDAFYASFGNVKSTGKRIGYFLDTSSSMRIGEVTGVEGLSPLEAESVMTSVLVQTERDFVVRGFTASPAGSRFSWRSGHESSDKWGMTDLPFTRRGGIDDAVRLIERHSYSGGTDCAAPFVWATENNVHLDAFVIHTDNESWAGYIHPSQALARYRQQVNPDARAIMVAYTATHSTINDPDDKLAMEFVGFDASAPRLMSEFIVGSI